MKSYFARYFNHLSLFFLILPFTTYPIMEEERDQAAQTFNKKKEVLAGKIDDLRTYFDEQEESSIAGLFAIQFIGSLLIAPNLFLLIPGSLLISMGFCQTYDLFKKQDEKQTYSKAHWKMKLIALLKTWCIALPAALIGHIIQEYAYVLFLSQDGKGVPLIHFSYPFIVERS